MPTQSAGAKALLVALISVAGARMADGALNPSPNTVIPRIAGVPQGVPERWNDASALRIFTTDSGTGNRQIEDSTTLYLRHDGTNLYAGWRCFDRSGKAVAFERSPMDNLMLDESVQIVMGLPGESKQLEMGGYADSQGVELAPVSHYYELTANAAGAVSRSYNETLLPNPRFGVEIFTIPEGKGWYAVMTIPWEVAGIDPEKNPKIYFNAFRFNHSIRYGWYLTAFGNYAAMPFGQAVLDGGCVVESEQVGVPVPTAAPSLVSTDASIDGVKMEYYPLSRMVTAVFPADARKRSAVLKLSNLGLEKTASLSDFKKTTIRLVVPVLEEGREIVASAGFSDGKSRTETFTALDPPEWYGTDAAGGYIDKIVPFPWTTPEWTNGTVRLVHCEVEFGAGVLPRQITVKNRKMLRAPIALRIKLSGAEAIEHSGSIVAASVDPTRVDLRTSAGRVEMRNMVDFDGFMVWRLRLNDVDTRDLEELTVTIPFASGVPKYVNCGSLQNTVTLDGHDYASNGGSIWVGGESIGLGVSSDRTVFFSEPDGRQVELIQREAGKMDLVLHLVTAAGQVPVSDQVFQLLLLPTPSRSVSPPPTNDKMHLLFEQWSDYQSYPDMSKLPEVKAAADAAHADNSKLYLYFGGTIAQDAPEHERYGIEWFAPPDRPWYSRAYDPGKGVPCSVACFRGAAGDLLVNRIDKFAKQAGLNGVYLDGVALPFGCENPSHDCSVTCPVEFDDDVRSGEIIGHRQFLKRLRGIFDARGERAPIWAHNGGGLTWNTLSLVDYLYEGEQLARYRKGYMLSPEQTLIGYSGKPFGYRGLFLPTLYANAAGLEQALPFSLVHDMEIHLGDYKSKVEKEFFSLVRKDDSARFYPYWEEQRHFERLSEANTYVSYYRSTNEAMIVAANLRYAGTQQVVLGLGKMFDVPIKQAEAVGTGRLHELEDSRLQFELPEGKCMVFRIRADNMFEAAEAGKDTIPETVEFKRISGCNTSDWQVVHGKKMAEVPEPGSSLPLKVVSIPMAAPGAIKFASLLPDTFTAKFQLCHEAAFQIRISDLLVMMDSWEGWQISGWNNLQVAGLSAGDPWGICDATQRWPNGEFYSAPQKVVPLEISVKEGRVILIYNGRYMLDNVLLEHPRSSYTLSFETWGGKWLTLGVDSIVPGVVLPREKRHHPVR